MNSDWESQLARAIEPQMQELVRRLQAAVDGLRPVYEVCTVIQDEDEGVIRDEHVRV